MTTPSEFHIIAAIAGAAAVTYGLRVGGLLLSQKLPRTGPFRRFMDALPGAILLSLAAPSVIAAGAWGVVAAGATALCTWRTGNVFLAMLTGMAIVLAQRHLL